MDWLPAERASIASILDRVPNGFFVLTAAHGEVRCGAQVRWVQQCAKAPPMIMVAIEKGQALSAIIRDCHGFALCQLHRDERILRRMLPSMPENGVDPFLSVPHLCTPSGAPVPLRAMSWFDCEMVRHIDIEADTEIYVGVVHHASVIQPGAPVQCHCANEPSCAEGPAPATRAPSSPSAAAHRAHATPSRVSARQSSSARASASGDSPRPHRSAASVATRTAKRR